MGLYKRKDSPSWWYKIKPAGCEKAIYKSTETPDRKLALSIMEKDKTDYLQGRHFGKATKITLRELADKYLPACKKQPSYETKAMLLENVFKAKQFDPKRDASAITPNDCVMYQNQRSEIVSPATVNREMGTLRHMYNYAINKMELNLKNPVSKLEFFSERKFRRDRHMSTEEKHALWGDQKYPRFYKNLAIFTVKTGLRQGELRNLKWTDIDFKNRLCRVVAGDEDETRFVPLHPIALDILRETQHYGEYVFSNEDGTKLSRYGAIVTSFERACARQKINDLRWHDLRHTFASDFMMGGGLLKTLQEYLGHKNIRMTERYAHLSPQYRQEQINVLPPEPGYSVIPLKKGQKVTHRLRSENKAAS